MSDRPHIMLLGLDGVNWSVVERDGVAPTLVGLRAEGAFRDLEVPMPTISGPSWTTWLTGASVEEHGIVDNDLEDHRLAEHPDLLTLAAEQEPGLRTLAVGSWPPLVHPDGPGPVVRDRPEAQATGEHQHLALDLDRGWYPVIDQQLTHYVVGALAHPAPPQVSFAYYGYVDEAGHAHGRESEQYTDTLRGTDAHVARIVEAVRRRHEEQGEQWIIAVITDHGHRPEGGHGGDSPGERAAFLLLWSPEGAQALPEIPADFQTRDLPELVLALRRDGVG